MTPEEFEAVLLTGDLEAMLKRLSDATEAERRALYPTAKLWWERTSEWSASTDQSWEKPAHVTSGQLRAITPLAVLYTAGLTELKKHRWLHVGDEETVRVLSDRRPAWTEAWAEWTLGQNAWNWSQVRALIRAGVIPQPAYEAYYLGLINGARRESVLELLRADPELIEQVWRLFEIEGSGDNSLAAHDKYIGEESTWRHAFLTLMGEGSLPRERLLDASLDALNRDFERFRVSWFSRFHEALEPTLEEREARVDRYLALLGSRIPPTVSFALKALAALDKASRLEGQALLGMIAPALAAREKGTVTGALKLLDRAAQRDAALSARAAALAAEALLHDAPDVQAAALTLVEKRRDPDDEALADTLRERLGDVAATLRPRLEALVGAPAAAEQASGAMDAGDLEARAEAVPEPWRALAGIPEALQALRDGTLPAALTLEGPVPRLIAGEEIAPIGTLEELIEAFGGVLENHGPPDEIERVMDGVSRLCAERPDDFKRLTAPLRKRAKKLHNPDGYTYLGWPPQDLPALALAWLDQEAPAPPDRKYTVDLTVFSGMRVQELAYRIVKQEARPLLAAPTHAGGWIDPRVLVQRAAQVPEPDLGDAVQALLRLAPDGRAEALAAAAEIAGEWGDALRYALGGEAKVGKTAALWVAAARSGAPRADAPELATKFKDVGPDGVWAGAGKLTAKRETYTDYDKKTHVFYRTSLVVTPKVPKRRPELPTVLHYVDTEADVPGRQWASMIWPGGRHAWFTAGVGVLANNLDWWEAEWSNRVFLEALLDPDTPLQGMGLTLLALGLAAKEPGETALAVDAFIMAVEDGRVAGHSLGDEMGALLVTNLIKPGRWAKTLAEGARASALHREVALQAVTRALGALHRHETAEKPPNAVAVELRPADILPLLTLLNELLAQSGAAVQDEDLRAYLSTVGGGKSGAAAKAILALAAGDHAASRREAAVIALEGRIARAERWGDCVGV